MERRRHARTPVNINALLIGEKSVPRGCRVINVSQHGMMLYCDTGGGLSNFRPGDAVDIHLTVQHADEQKKLSIPSCIKHVAENSVDVEFYHPDAILMDLIESYRISDQHKLEASLGHNRTPADKVTPITPATPGRIGDMQQETARTPEPASGSRTFYLLLLTLVIAACIITGGYIYTASIDSRIGTLESTHEQQAGELSELKNRLFSTNLQEGRYESLDTRITALAHTLERLEQRLDLSLPASPLVESSAKAEPAAVQQPPPATVSGPATQPDTGTVDRGTPADTAGTTATDTTGESEDELAAALEAELAVLLNPGLAERTNPEPPAAQAAEQLAAASGPPESTPVDPEPTAQHAAPPRADGPWIINLLSSPDRSYVERMADRVRTQDVKVVISEADVGGRHYWRLRIPGFASAADAREHAKPVTEMLGIGDAWILKQ